MKLFKIFIFILTAPYDCFGGIICSKLRKSDGSEIIFKFGNSTSLRNGIEKIIKTRADINKPYKVVRKNWVEFGRITTYANLLPLHLSIDTLDVENVKLLLENGANPNVEYIEELIDLDTLIPYSTKKYLILNFVSSKLNSMLSDK